MLWKTITISLAFLKISSVLQEISTAPIMISLKSALLKDSLKGKLVKLLHIKSMKNGLSCYNGINRKTQNDSSLGYEV